MVDAMEKEIPITVLAETLTTGGVMQGLHTIDVATLVNPVIVEFLKGVAENAEIKYELGDKTVDEDIPTPSMLERSLADLKKGGSLQDEVEIEEEDVKENISVGLMSRREELV